MRRPLLEVLVDAAPGRGDDYIRLDPTRDMRHERASAAQGGDAYLYRLVKRSLDRTLFAGPWREGEGCLLSVRVPAVRYLRRLAAGGERSRSGPTVLTVSPSALTGVGRAAQLTGFRQGDVSSFQAELVAFRAGQDDPAHAGRLAGLHCGAEAARTSVQPAGRRPAGSGPRWTRFLASFGLICGGGVLSAVDRRSETRCGEPAAQAIPEALSGLYPGARSRSWSWRRRKPILPPSMTG